MKKKEPILLVLAAGMGSRYGGLKQIDPVGPSGEIIIDYSLYDAVKAGFRRFIFIVKKENEEAFQEVLFQHLPEDLELKMVFQDPQAVPDDFSIPVGREKPWGTTHAICAAKEEIDAPFAVINADDYYGPKAFQTVYQYLMEVDQPTSQAMVGFHLRNTLTENGSVSRGVCNVENGKLTGIDERKAVFKDGDGARFELDDVQHHLPGDTIVSMNFWGFHPDIMPLFEKDLDDFFRNDVEKNPLKSEALLPETVGRAVQSGQISVDVLTSGDTWMGVTYREDKERVATGFRDLVARGVYPSPLWEKK